MASKATAAAPVGRAFWFALLAALAILIGLGTWQMQRRAWKLGLIERIEQRAHSEPVSLTSVKEQWQRSQDIEYSRVLLVGRFEHGQERHLYTVENGTAGWRVMTPLITAGGDVVFVDRGFVPEPLKEPDARGQGQIEGMVELIGLARAQGGRNWFTPDNDPARNRWFWRDIPAMGAALPAGQAARALPFVVEAEAEPVPGGWPRGGPARLVIPNRHLEYALTWYALGVVLLFVAFFYVRSRRGAIERA